MQIESALLKDTKLHLCVKPKPNHIHVLQVLVDGKRRDEAIIGAFENVVLDLGADARAARKVTVRGYDRYLHYAEQTVMSKST